MNEKYAEHKAEYDAQDKAAKEAAEASRKKREEEEAARKQAAPYEGMSESRIDSTDLGRHSEYYAHYNTECINGEIYSASMYYWYSGNDCIFSARCVRGSVWSVWDNRDRTVKNNIVEPYSGNKTKKENTTEFDPDDHDIDMYYEDYKDEFEDEDDAWDDFEDNDEYWDDY